MGCAQPLDSGSKASVASLTEDCWRPVGFLAKGVKQVGKLHLSPILAHESERPQCVQQLENRLS